MTLDTLPLSKDLQPIFNPQQAEALSRALASYTGVGDHATKADLATLRIEIKADVATQLATFKVDVVRWIVGSIAFNVLATAGLIVTLTRTLAH